MLVVVLMGEKLRVNYPPSRPGGRCKRHTFASVMTNELLNACDTSRTIFRHVDRSGAHAGIVTHLDLSLTDDKASGYQEAGWRSHKD